MSESLIIKFKCTAITEVGERKQVILFPDNSIPGVNSDIANTSAWAQIKLNIEDDTPGFEFFELEKSYNILIEVPGK